MEHAGFRAELDGGSYEDEEDFARSLSHELHVVAEHYGSEGGTFSSACLEAPEGGVDEERRAQHIAENVLYGWPRVSEEPTPFRLAGRFVKAFPLKFPIGEGGLFDWRHVDVTPHEWVQHLVRFWDGRFVKGESAKRFLWAAVNTVLLTEASGKGFVVHRNVMRRLGHRVVGATVVTKGQLREMLQSEEALRSMMYQLMSVGRDVRATPMQMSYEGKKLDAAMKVLSWRPPWVEDTECEAQGAARLGSLLLGQNAQVKDELGLGRVAATWFTLNCKYNSVFDVQRLNIDAPPAVAAAAVDPENQAEARTRFSFVVDAPDLVTHAIALRTELLMRIVMPAILPCSEQEPFLSMARFEASPGGHFHAHGFAYAARNPRLARIRADPVGGGAEDEAPPSSEDTLVSGAAESASDSDGEAAAAAMVCES